jgi:hypothetical protein
MTTSGNYIPSGKTSLVKKNDKELQVQTEYSSRPFPRIKTTIFDQGRVVHKVEKKLSRPVDSVEEQNRIEGIMKHQHMEVVTVIRDSDLADTGATGKIVTQPEELSTQDRLASISGVQWVFRIDRDGNFSSQSGSQMFQKAYAEIFKSLSDIMDIFATLPGSEDFREKGVYEIERDRLYYVSGGNEFFLVTISRPDRKIRYENSFREIVCPPLSF